MSKYPEGVTYRTGWEDGECASVEELICPCGYDLREGCDSGDFIVGNDEVICCPKCQRKYRFVWVGMTVEEVEEENNNAVH